MEVFRKGRAGAPAGYFAWEAAGLRWLADAGGAPVVRVVALGDDHLDLERLEPVAPSRPAARAFGAALARTHDAGAPAFGSGPEGWRGPGWFGPLAQPLPLVTGSWSRWGEFLARGRVEPLAEALARAGLLDDEDRRRLDALVGRLERGDLDDDDVPARLHGDLWSGNVLWTAAGATLVDPAAHGGHRESDLAMLELFGAPFLDDVLAGYDDVHALRPGRRRRLPLHQLYPVGVHALLFGGHYVAQTRALLRALG
ncbi:fructosamine kinase family protein [Cellulomonas massiliensis]|uniref:fructosamine kinase family protein n=1 Tax=Cellulomonas massiliensis TaxID=1465811 RepID=UPI0003193F79|nr:fructosamine kinase family protein [Cellulomonas massiliensis]